MSPAVLGCDNGPGFEEEEKLILRADLVKVVFKETMNGQSERNVDQLLTPQASH